MIKILEKAVCKVCEISEDELRNGGAKRVYSSARSLTWYILHYNLGYSAHAIAKEYGRSDRGVKKMIANIKFQLRGKDLRSKYDIVCMEIEKAAEP